MFMPALRVASPLKNKLFTPRVEPEVLRKNHTLSSTKCSDSPHNGLNDKG